MLLGVARMLLEFTNPAPLCGEPENRPTILYKVHYLYFGMLSVACTTIIAMSVSLVTPPIDHRCVSFFQNLFVLQFQKQTGIDRIAITIEDYFLIY